MPCFRPYNSYQNSNCYSYTCTLYIGVEKCTSQVTKNIRKTIAAAHNSSADPECEFPVGSYANPASSCKEIAQLQPHSASGYYWTGISSTNIRKTYCDMTRRCNSTEGWMRVAYLDMTNNLTTCPPGFRQITSPKRACGRTQQSAGCSSVTFSAHGTAYSKICGRIIGYQDGSPSGFYTSYYAGSSIEGPYLEGVSVTHGRTPRKHIWSFANALQEAYGFDHNRHICPCRPRSAMQQYIPSFVGNDYFCDTGIQDNWRSGVFYPDDPLWDGQGCTLQPACCSFHSPPWFCKKLTYSTADDIEVRICADQGYLDEDSPIELIEIFVQ